MPIRLRVEHHPEPYSALKLSSFLRLRAEAVGQMSRLLVVEVSNGKPILATLPFGRGAFL